LIDYARATKLMAVLGQFQFFLCSRGEGLPVQANRQAQMENSEELLQSVAFHTNAKGLSVETPALSGRHHELKKRNLIQK